MVKLVDIHGPSAPYRWDFTLEQKWREERGLDGVETEIPYEVMQYIEKLEERIAKGDF